MRPLGQLAVIGALLSSLPSLRADEAITNIISPIVTYQYPNDLGSEAFTNGGIHSPPASYVYPNDFGVEALTNGGVLSPIASFVYCEWPGDDVLHLQNSPSVSYFYQFSSFPGSALLAGRVTDLSGVPLAGATVSAAIYLLPVAQATTDAGGNYQIPSLDAGIYNLQAVDATHQTAIRTLALSAYTARQDFQLKPMPTAPVAVQTDRQPELTATSDLMGSELKVFDGVAFQTITPSNKPSSSRMTIVLTHGWNSDPSAWAQGMAMKMHAQGVTDVANIVAWDWRKVAQALKTAEENTLPQGTALGKELLKHLESNYQQPLHFIGHSLGTLVNAAAANYLQGDQTAQQEVSPTPGNMPIHVTLLDEAEIARVPGAMFDGFGLVFGYESGSARSFADVFSWKSPVPVRSAWTDNYVSAVGWHHANAANVRLIKEALGSPSVRHAYAHQWYGMTVTNPSGCILGFKQSYEARQANLSAFDFSQAWIDFPRGVSYEQDFASNDPLALVYMSASGGRLGQLAELVVQGAEATVQFAGNVTVQVQSAAQTSGQLISRVFNCLENATLESRSPLVHIADSAVLRLTLSTLRGVVPVAQGNLPRSSGEEEAGGDSNSAPMIWLPLHVPANATALAFDFIVSGDPADDSLVCGVSTNRLFSLQAKYIPTNAMSSSSLIDASAWAGTTNELFFGFLGGTSTNAVLEIENIRFYSVQPPHLTMEIMDNNAVLSWPLSAVGFMVESTESLNATNAWTTITNIPAIANDQFCITNQMSAASRFFRLR